MKDTEKQFKDTKEQKASELKEKLKTTQIKLVKTTKIYRKMEVKTTIYAGISLFGVLGLLIFPNPILKITSFLFGFASCIPGIKLICSNEYMETRKEYVTLKEEKEEIEEQIYQLEEGEEYEKY